MPTPPHPFRLFSGSYPGDWGAFLVAYESRCIEDLEALVKPLINSRENHRQHEGGLRLSPAMANAMELMDMAIGNDDPELLDVVRRCHPDVLLERSMEEISPSSTTGLCAMSSSGSPDLPLRATWLELACFRLSNKCLDLLLSLGLLQSQPKERLGWPAGLSMWSYAESRVWIKSHPMLQALGLLHAHGADFNHPDPWGRLPLCLLSRSAPPAQTMDICARLMKMGASVSGPLDENGAVRNERPYRNCPALENIRQGNMAAVSCFLSAHPCQVVSSRSDGGNTALHVLAIGAMGSAEPAHNVVALALELIDKGCDPDAENDDGMTPMEFAVGQDNLVDLGKALFARGARLDRGPRYWPLLFTACACEDPSSAGKQVIRPSILWLKWLISKGCSPNDRVLGRSVVHHIMQTQPRITIPGPNKRPKPCSVGVLAEVIAAGWRPLAGDSGSIEDMVMLTNPGPSLDSADGWLRLENRERIIFLVNCAIHNGWFDDPMLPPPSPEFASMMGSVWSKHLLDRGTSWADTDADHRRF